MCTEQENMHCSLGVFGVYQESCIIIVSCRKTFSHITFTLLLPLASFIFLIYKHFSHLLLDQILRNSIEISKIQRGTPHYENLTQTISSQWDTFLLLLLTCFTFIFLFYLLSTFAAVHTVASFYTTRKVSSTKVYERLTVTFLCSLLDFLVYNFIQVLITWALLTYGPRNYCGVAAMAIVYIAGLVYMNVVWKLASVVTLLEDTCGFEAMAKSRELVKGKIALSVLAFLGVVVPFFAVQFMLVAVVVRGYWEGLVGRTVFGIVSLVVSSCLLMLELVLQSVLYFVCKSYHCDNIRNSDLYDLLEICTQEKCEPLI